MLTKHFRNISNYFSEVEDIGRAMDWLMDSSSEAVFGAEIEIEPTGVSSTLITPPYIRLGVEVDKSRLVDDEEDLTCYEGYLVEPHFLPLYEALNGVLLSSFENLMLEEGEIVSLQWMFRKRLDNWKERAVEMYGSYLDGNDYPLQSTFGRVIQNKVLGILNRIASFDTAKPYLQEVENKLMSEGYQFQLRVLIKSGNPVAIKERLEDIFKQYDSYNALRLYRIKEKRFRQLYRDVVLTYNSNTQILSRQEVASLFGGKQPIVAPPAVVAQTKAPAREEVETEIIDAPPVIEASGIISLLPFIQRHTVVVDKEAIITDIADALKRVGLSKQARIFNESVTAGIRLTVVQCDIPKGKTLTNISSKTKDIQAELGVQSLGVEQGTEPGQVKFAIPNEDPAIISLRELIELPSFQEFAENNPLAFIVGVDEINNPIYLSLAKLVHLMVAGTTGSGKSVFVNTICVCLLSMYTPEELRMFMIDPKQVELQHYEGFPHVEEVITDMEEAAGVLEQLTTEMEQRYTQFKEVGVKNIVLYNKKAEKKMPYIVCVIDEYADLKDTNPEVEDSIVRLGQLARAAGIHLVIATQRPSANIVSGRIKSNVQNAISFNLGNNTNYKTVFGQGIGGVTLLGQGDGMMKIMGYPKLFQRFQSAIISPDEAKEEEIFDNMKAYYQGYRPKSYFSEEVESEQPIMTIEEGEAEVHDPEDLLDQLKKIIATTGETKVEPLRKELGVKMTTLQDLMSQLVDEGWLIRHNSKAKGYELIIEDDVLEPYKAMTSK